MAEILKEWLSERLQRPIKWKPHEFGEMMKNGHVVASILCSYDVISNGEMLFIRPSNHVLDIKSNWRFLRDWLRRIEVFVTDKELYDIVDGKGSVLLRLFYQLFLYLDKQDRTDFIKREREMVCDLIKNMGDKFREKSEDTEESPLNYLAKPLINERQFIDWQKKKAEEIRTTHDYIRNRCIKFLDTIEEKKLPCDRPKKNKALSRAEKTEMAKFCLRYPCKFQNYTYEELLGMEEQCANRRKSQADSEWAEKYMSDLHQKLSKRAQSEEFHKQLHNVLNDSLWELSAGGEEEQVDSKLATKVMKLSQFEKQMCTQIMETKQQARNIATDRVDADRQHANERDLQFHQYLDNLREHLRTKGDFETRRRERLHKKLYAEKMKRMREEWYEICYDTMLAIIDYVTNYSYWNRLMENDLPDHFIKKWKNIFFKKTPIFESTHSMRDLLKEHGSLELVPLIEIEDVTRLDLDRQDAISDSDFSEYHNYLNSWNLDLLLPNYDPDDEERKIEYLGKRIMGHVVFSLLEIKYPYPPQRPPADLPPFQSKAIVIGLPDKSVTALMQILLNKHKIFVVRLESAINFCLRQFKREMVGCTEIDIAYDKFIAAQQEEEGKEFVRSLKAEEEQYNRINEAISILLWIGPIPPNCKQTQTPKVLPEEDILLSTAAELGKYAYEALDFGDSLTDHLISAILVEYIKEQESINGFVIINYPNNYNEAQILEETFSGRAPPDEEELLDDRDKNSIEEIIYKHRKKEKDPYQAVRVSKVVSNPHKRKSDFPFESYFTCYIRMKESEEIIQEDVIWDLKEENYQLIDTFYTALGINYSLYYESVEKDLLALICKYIIGDLSMPLKSYDILFGENVLNTLDFSTNDDKKIKSKVLKPEPSTIKSKDRLKRSQISKIGKLETAESEVTKSPELVKYALEEQVWEVEGEEYSIISEETPVKALPGEDEWQFALVNIPEIIGVALATCWEEIEKFYVHDLEQLFLSERIQLHLIAPYCTYIKSRVEDLITMPSAKQELVRCFQKQYNDFEEYCHDMNATRHQWHCRVKELKDKLYTICDKRKQEQEKLKTELIMENWAGEELTMMANTFISCLQTELNRSLVTFHIIHDFYFASLRKMPTADRISAKEMTKISRDLSDAPGRKKGAVDDTIFKQLRQAFREIHLNNIVMDYSNNPMNMLLNDNVQFAMKVVKDCNENYRSLIIKERIEIENKNTTKKKDDANQETTIGSEIKKSKSPEEEFRQNALKSVEEWIMAINGEMFRAYLRFQAIKFKCLRDMKLFNDCIYKTFTEIQDLINKHYANEIKSIERLCKYIHINVEKSKKIPDYLLLEHDYLLMEPDLLQFTPQTPVAETSDTESEYPMLEFKVCQLAYLRNQLKILAPTGFALKSSFIYSLQDFIFFGQESCEGQRFPEIFRQIDPEKVPRFVLNLYGDTVYVDWRDFLIFCLNIRFPKVDELLDARTKFRCQDRKSTELINRNKFMEVELWFEKEFDSTDQHAQLRKCLIKHFLFELFETKEDQVNYSALLLAFCKNRDPIAGFAMALTLAVGKKVCFSWETCGHEVCGLIQWKKYRDECLERGKRYVAEVIEEIIDKVIQFCTSITFTEVPYEEDMAENMKMKGKKAKKHDNRSTSARLLVKPSGPAATQKSNANVREQPPPAPEPPPPKEVTPAKEVEEEELEGEHIEEVLLEYAVPQKVIQNILKISLPFHYGQIPDRLATKYEEQLVEVFRKLEVNHIRGDIYVSQFVVQPSICKMLHSVRKFTALNLIEEINKACY